MNFRQTRFGRFGVCGAIICTLAFGNISSSTTAHAQSYVSESAGRIERIQVDGAQRIEPETIIAYMDVRPGDPMTQENLDRALKSLFGTGLFADVVLRRDTGGVLVVTVKENPIIYKIAFEGNEEIEDDELRAEVQLRPRQVFTQARVKSDVSRLYQIYRRKGRFAANIEPKIIQLDQNRVNLVFEIDDGPITTIESIRFVGNKRFSDSSLRSEIASKEYAWYRFLSESDRYDPDKLEFDKELLRRFYLKEGYVDFELVSAVAELSPERDKFFVTFTMNEGERFKIDDINISSQLPGFDTSLLKEDIKIEKGDWYNSDEIQESIDNMTTTLENNQFPFVSIRSKIKRHREGNVVDIMFDIRETQRLFVERININGNLRTEDRVIRRKLTLVEGDPFVNSKLAQSKKNIQDLNYFEKMDVQTRPGSAPDKRVVDVDVSEKSTGEFSIGAGFSTSEGPLADIRLTERNFLGKGQQFQVATTFAGERTEIDFGFTEPYFMGRDLAAGVDLFHVTRDFQDESSFDQKRTGGGVRLGYPLSLYWRQLLSYRLEENEITDIQDDASLFIQDQEGKRITSAIAQRLTYDARDSKIFPTDGLLGWFETELAGVGGDAQYVSARTGASYFYPITEKVIFNILGEGGAITDYGDEELQINERFFLGGATLRGFETSGVGPRDLRSDDSLGGEYFYRSTVELTFPVGLPEELGFSGHLFSDAGSLYEVKDDPRLSIADENSIRVSVGTGLSWRSPLGPLRADFAFPVAEEDYDDKEIFRFNFGTRF